MTSSDFDDLLDSLEIVESAPSIPRREGASVEKRIESLRDLLDEINKTIDIDFIINITIDHIAADHAQCALFLLAEESRVYSKTSRNMDESSISSIRHHLNKLDTSMGVEHLSFTEYHLDEIIYYLYPLISNNELFGFLALGNTENQMPDILERDFSAILAAQLAILIEKSLLYGTITSSQDQLDIKMEELQALYDELLTLYDFSQSSSSIFEMPDLLKLALEKANKTVEAEKTLVITIDSEKIAIPEYYIGWEKESLPKHIGTEGTVFDKAVEAKDAIIANNFFGDENWNSLEKTGLETKDMLVAPIYVHGDLFGYIVTGNRLSNKPYTSQHQRLIASMAAQTGKNIENIKLYGEYVEKQKLQRDLDVAHEIQTSLLPRHAPHYESLELCGYSNPAREVGGDFYDFIELDDSQVGLTVGDVSGKGIPAALLMAMTKSVIRSEASSERDLPSSFYRINNIICHDMISGKFITLLYIAFNYKRGTARFVSAGHHPPLIYRMATGEYESVSAEGLPIGIMEDTFFEESSFEIQPNDVIALFTDGILEAMNEEHDEYGMERFQDVLKANCELPLEALKNAILDDVEAFTDGAPQHDDTTLVLARYLGDKGSGRSIMRKFSMRSDLERLDQVTLEISEALTTQCAPDDVKFDVKLMVSELIINAITHGNCCDPSKSIFVHYELKPGYFMIKIHDEGEGIDEKLLEIEPDDKSLEKEHGRGIYLVRELSDKFTYLPETCELYVEKSWPTKNE